MSSSVGDKITVKLKYGDGKSYTGTIVGFIVDVTGQGVETVSGTPVSYINTSGIEVASQGEIVSSVAGGRRRRRRHTRRRK